MADPYSVLGIGPEADDAAVRLRYLSLAREFTPEQHPERFAAIRAAYEKIKTLDDRARHRLLAAGTEHTIESIIEEAACRTPRRRAGLRELIATVLPAK